MSLAEMLEESGDEPDYIAAPYFVRGGLTDLSGPAKRSGKTTFTLHLIRELLDGGTFLDEPTQTTKVLYLTEQGDNFVQAALAVGLDPEHPGLKILPWHTTRGYNWPDIVEAVKTEAKEFGAGLVVVDTLNRFAGLKGDEENSAGHVGEAMNPLLEAAQADHLCVLAIRHANKEGRARGSTQFDHDVDQILTLKRPEAGYADNVRELDSVGRYHNGASLIELTDDGYKNLGSGPNVKFTQALRGINEMVSADPENPTRRTLITTYLKENYAVSESTAKRALNKLVEGEELIQTQAKGQGGPVAFYKAPLDVVEDDGDPLLDS